MPLTAYLLGCREVSYLKLLPADPEGLQHPKHFYVAEQTRL